MKKLFFVFGIVMLFSLTSFAQSNEYYVGYSFKHENVKFSKVSPTLDKVYNGSGVIGSYTRYLDSRNRFGLTGEVGFNYTAKNSYVVTAMVGTTIKARDFSKYADPYAKAVVGVAKKDMNFLWSGKSSYTGFAYAVGAGVDFKVAKKVNLRVGADLVNTNFYGERSNSLRLHTGLVW